MTRARNSANLASDGNLFVDISNDRTGIGSVAPAQNLHVAGTAGFHDDVTFVGDLYSATWDRSNNRLDFDADAILRFNENQFNIYNDGSGTSFIKNRAINLRITSDIFRIRKANDSTHYINCEQNRVQLYKSGNEKFRTEDYGVQVTGTTDTDGLVVSGVATVTTMNVTGVLTYDDVTSVDSVGIVTARQGVVIPSSNQKIVVGPSGNLEMFYSSSHGSLLNTSDGGDIRLRIGGNTRGTFSSGGFQVNGGVFVEDSIHHTGDTATRIRFPSNDTINLNTGGTTMVGITTRTAISSHTGAANGYGQLSVNTSGTGDGIGLFIGAYAAIPSTHASGNATTGVTTAIYVQSGLNKRPEIRFHNTHNGNWHDSPGNTSHLRMVWTTPESSTTPEVVDIHPRVVGSAGGAFDGLRIRVTDNSNGLRNCLFLQHDNLYFHVNNSTMVQISGDGLGINDSLYHRGDTNTKIRFPSNDNISFETAGSERLRITASGEVNIGGNLTQTTAPLCVTTDANSFGIRLMTGSNKVVDILNNDAAGSCEIRGYYNNNSGTQGEGFRLEANGASFFNPGGNSGLQIDSSGNVLAHQTFYVSDAIQHIGDTNTKIRFPANDTFTVETNAAERLRIHSTGDIGINFSGTPNATLDIRTDRDPSNGIMCFLRNNANDGNGAMYGMDINGCGNWSCGMLDNSDAFSIVDGLGNSGTEYFRIDSNGRLLLGTTSVYSATGGGKMMVSVKADGASRTDLSVSNQSSVDNASAAVVLATHGQDYILEATGSGNSTDGASAFRILKSGTERFRIASDGDVVIGNSSPVAGKLEINVGDVGNSATEYHGEDFAINIRANRGESPNEEGNGICFSQRYATSDGGIVRTGAIVGYKVQGDGAFGGGLKFKTQQAGANAFLDIMRMRSDMIEIPHDNVRLHFGVDGDFRIRHTGSENQIYGTGAHPITFSTSGNNERLRIDASGNVMIGRTSASKKFSVREGSTSSGVYYVQQIGGSNHLANYAVGIAFDPEGYEARTKMALVAEGISQGYSRGKFHFLLDAANDSGEATLSESRMTITDAGNVGINANSPGTQLVVRAPGGSGHASAQVHSGDGNTVINMQTVQGVEGRFGMNTNHPLCFYTNGLQHLKMLATGALQHTATSGVSYFTGSSEYVFGSNQSSPPSGGPEGKFQIHDHKTRVTLSVNGYMNNAGGPILQMVSSRSGTKGVLGTKAAMNDYHGDIRFMGDNGTNNNSLVQSAQILVRQKSTISDGDTVCAGEMSFYTGSDSAGSILERLKIDSGGRLTLSNSEGIKLSPKNSSMYALDGTLSYYATNNGVYLNGAGANGWLRLNASGVNNDRTSINLTGHTASNGDSIHFRTNSSERMRIFNDGHVQISGEAGATSGNLHVGVNGATGNFTDSGNGNTKHIEIGATNGGDALLTTHASGKGIGYFGYEAGGDRLIIACDDGGGGNKIDFVTNAGTSTGGSSDNLNGKQPKMRIKSGGGGVQIYVHESATDFQPKHDVTALLIQNGIGGGDIGGTSEPTHIDWAWVDSNANDRPQCRISGNVGDGGDPNSLQKEGKGFLTFHCSDTNSSSTNDIDPPQRLRIAHNGTFTGSSSNNISDQRLKENIATITDPIAKIKALKGRTFTWKSEARMREGTHYGFVAQEVESIIPDLIVDDTGIRVFDKDDNLQPSNVITPPVGGGYAKSVDSDGVTPVLVEALKEALAKIEVLEAKVAALEG